MAYGFKDFTAGDVLTAAQVDDYLQRQAVMQFDDATARDAALTVSIVREGMVAYLKDTDLFTVYTGSAWINFGGIGSWISYTPTLTNLTLGNGTLVGKYMREGRTIHYRFKLTWGSTTSCAGTQSFSLPAAAHADYTSTNAPLGTGSAQDATAGGHGLWAYWNTASVSMITYAGSAVNATSPMTWTTNDVLIVTGTYESAA